MADYRICEIDGCGKRHEALGLCQTHYVRQKRHGSPLGGKQRKSPPCGLCSVSGCDRETRARDVCFTHYKQWERYGFSADRRPEIPARGRRYVNHLGYVVFRDPKHPLAGKGNGLVHEHRLVMSQIIGRPLLKGENVHHKNGNRADNRPENLELWVSSQPSGQRPRDLLEWAREIIDRYGDFDA